MVIGSAFADVRFSGAAKVLWGYDFNNQEFTVSGRDYASIRETYNYGKIYNTSAAANLTVKVVGDYFSFNFIGALYSRSNDKEGINARISAVEGKVSYTFVENNLKPTLAATAGYMLSRKSLPGEPIAVDDKGFMFSVSGQITVLGLNVKLGYTFREFEPNKYFGTSKAYIELNFKF